MSDYATLAGPNTVRLERLLPGPIERVWSYLADSDKRATWLAAGPLPTQPSTDFTLHFQHAKLSIDPTPTPESFREFDVPFDSQHRLLRSEPPHFLSFTWGGGIDGAPSIVTIELTPQADKVRLVLTHSQLAGQSTMAQVAGGWHTHFDILIDRLNDREPPSFWTTFANRHAAYSDLFTSVTVTHALPVPPERAFAACVDPALVDQWLFTGPTSEAHAVDLDVHVGGKWKITDRRDGADYTAIGEYLEIAPPHRLLFTFGMPQFSPEFGRVLIEITPTPTGCQFTLTQKDLPYEYQAPTREGWQQMLPQLAAIV